MAKKEINPPGKDSRARDAGTGRIAKIGGVAVRVAHPVTSLSSDKKATIRTAVRGYYADKKSGK